MNENQFGTLQEIMKRSKATEFIVSDGTYI